MKKPSFYRKNSKTIKSRLKEFLTEIAAVFGTKFIKHTPFSGKKVKKIAPLAAIFLFTLKNKNDIS
jgi:hypothetical protein